MHLMRSTRGFTLVEIAIVLLIISLLLGAILVPLGSAFEESQRTGVKRQLEEVGEALIGFAVSRGRLPCPATGDSNGEEVILDTASGQCEEFHGFVPAVTLGLLGETNADGLLVDIWNNPLRYSVTDTDDDGDGLFDFTFAGGMRAAGIAVLDPDFVICTSGTTSIGCPDIGGDGNTLRANQIPAVVLSMGKDWREFDGIDQLANAGEDISGGVFDDTLTGGNTSIEYPIPANDVFVAKPYTQIDGDEKFDDLVYWISENILYTRMLQAGVLP
ncbi:MAG: prepilin-type N-terminal cleavage/methylation domain-containing protein [Pseudomonadota bacterium]